MHRERGDGKYIREEHITYLIGFRMPEMGDRSSIREMEDHLLVATLLVLPVALSL
jgi:hypothetical protein